MSQPKCWQWRQFIHKFGASFSSFQHRLLCRNRCWTFSRLCSSKWDDFQSRLFCTLQCICVMQFLFVCPPRGMIICTMHTVKFNEVLRRTKRKNNLLCMKESSNNSSKWTECNKNNGTREEKEKWENFQNKKNKWICH